MKILGLVNARGGSKGIPRKNIKPLAGKPLIAYAIEAARLSQSIDDVVVSTDDPEIAAVARRFDAETPFMRPPELATDTAIQIDVILHALHELAAVGRTYDIVAILQPTAPLRSAADIDGALQPLIDGMADSVATFSPAPCHPYYMYQLVDGRAEKILPVPENLQRQEFPEMLMRNGAVYASRVDLVEQHRVLTSGRFKAYVMPSERSVNIDTPLDWRVAEILVQEKLTN